MTNSEKKTILLVEDEVLIAMNEKNDLEKYGYEVIIDHSGEKAVEVFKKNNAIELVLMDINLGNGIDGAEAAKIILDERETPVIFLSCHIEREIVDKTQKIRSYGYVVKNSGIAVLDASIKTALRLFETEQKIKNELIERKQIEETLLSSEQIQRELLQDLDRKLRESEYTQLWNVYAQSRVPTFTANKSGKIIDFNQAMVDLTGYTHPEVPDIKTLISLSYPDEANRPETIEVHRKYPNKEINFSKEVFIITTKKGGKRHIMMSVYDILHQNQPTDLKVIQVEDITEQKKIERALNESELKYRMLFKSMGQGFYLSQILYDENGIPYDYKYIDVNSAFEKIMAMRREQIIGKTYNELVPPDPASGWPECFKRVAITGIPENYAFSSEIYKTYFETYAFRPEEGKFAALVKDVTDRVKAEETIKKLLYEKEIILKEVHHRIKNNMNVVSSLLELHSNSESNPASKNVLHDAANRIRSMTILYDKLYRSENISSLSIKTYLICLIDEISKIFSNITSVQIKTQIDDIILDSKLLSPLGIIVNELLTNAMKFAFIGRNDGIITISATKKNKYIIIVLEDNGTGLPESVTFENSTGFGMRLVGLLVKQINGSITIVRQNGTKFMIEFEE